MNAETFIKGQLAARCHRDGALHGGINNMLAVAFVHRNRRAAGWRGGDWMPILGSSDEYAGTLYPPTTPDLRDINFRMLLSQIDDVFSGIAPDRMTEGALFYCELNNVNNAWFSEHVLRQPAAHPRVATVGNVSFFR